MGREIHVVFIDAASGLAFAESRMPAESLPRTFEVETNLNLDGEDWHVVEAEPKTAAEFRRTGKLTLTVERRMTVPVEDILFSLPTICDRLPALDERPARPSGLFEIHEDRWRQVELISARWEEEIEAEFEEIEAIFREHAVEGGEILGFKRIHIRKRIERPIAVDLSREELSAAFPSVRAHEGLGFEGADRPVRGGFAFRSGGAVIHGFADGGLVQAVAVDPASAGPEEIDRLSGSLARIMEDKDLLLVDWCRVRKVPPDAGAVREYLLSVLG